MTWKQSQGYQTYNENVDFWKGCNSAQLERSCFNCVQEKSTLKSVFLKNNFYEEVCQLSPLNMCENQKQWYTKFQHNWIKIKHFQIKVFDTAVTLKYNQGH